MDPAAADPTGFFRGDKKDQRGQNMGIHVLTYNWNIWVDIMCTY